MTVLWQPFRFQQSIILAQLPRVTRILVDRNNGIGEVEVEEDWVGMSCFPPGGYARFGLDSPKCRRSLPPSFIEGVIGSRLLVGGKARAEILQVLHPDLDP